MDIEDEKLVAPVKRKLKVTDDKKINVKKDVDDKESGGKKNRSTPADQDETKSSEESKFIQELEELNDNKSINPFIKHILKKNGFNDVSIFAEIDLNELIELVELVEKDMKENPKYYKDICPKLRFSKKNKILLEKLIQKSKEKLEKEKEIAEEPETETQFIKKRFRCILNGHIMTMMESGYYVDKTKYMQKLIEKEGCYLITRPRRFGKSVMLNTIAKICEGKDSKELFKNTAIGKSPTYQWKKYPVFKFNFSTLTTSSVEDFKNGIIYDLKKVCKKYNIKYDEDSRSIQKLFKDMVEGGVKLKNGYEPKVVILIDEYDEPLYRSCEKKIENEITKIIQEFYSILTSYILKNKIHMVLITGAAKLYMTKIFNNSVNNIVDITLDKKVNAICGYTHSELITVFEDQLDKMCRELNETKDKLLVTLKREYGGYKFCKFSKETIYNPWSILNFFVNYVITGAWRSKNLKHFINVAFRDIEIMLLALKDPSFIAYNQDLSQLNFNDKYVQISLKSFLFETGLLTIDKYDKETQKYTLKIPNREAERLLEDRIKYNCYFSDLKINNPTLLKILENRDVKVFIDCLQLNLSKWPYNNKQCESTAYHIYLCDVIQEIYQLTRELMTVKNKHACEPTREDVIATTFNCMCISQLKGILDKLK